MKPPLYLSSGAFTGRINGRNPRLLYQAAEAFSVDGFELMVFEDLYAHGPALFADYRAAGIPIPVLHADKAIGDLVSLPDGAQAALALFEKNLDIAALVGAERIVTHCWGMPPSDRYTDLIYDRIGALQAAAAARGMTLLCENCVCANHSPLYHMQNLHARYPTLQFTMDTRCAEFHAELPATMEAAALWPAITHLHINDYRGGYKEWSARYPIPQPPEEQIDWPYFFAMLKARGFRGSITLEAPAMLAEGLNVPVLSHGLDFIRHGLASQAL